MNRRRGDVVLILFPDSNLGTAVCCPAGCRAARGCGREGRRAILPSGCPFSG